MELFGHATCRQGNLPGPPFGSVQEISDAGVAAIAGPRVRGPRARPGLRSSDRVSGGSHQVGTSLSHWSSTAVEPKRCLDIGNCELTATVGDYLHDGVRQDGLAVDHQAVEVEDEAQESSQPTPRMRDPKSVHQSAARRPQEAENSDRRPLTFRRQVPYERLVDESRAALPLSPAQRRRFLTRPLTASTGVLGLPEAPRVRVAAGSPRRRPAGRSCPPAWRCRAAATARPPSGCTPYETASPGNALLHPGVQVHEVGLQTPARRRPRHPVHTRSGPRTNRP